MSVPVLSLEAQELVLAGRLALRPTIHDRDRIGAALQARLAGVGESASVQAATASTGGVALGKVLLAPLALGLLIAVVAFFTQHTSRSTLERAGAAPPDTAVDVDPLQALPAVNLGLREVQPAQTTAQTRLVLAKGSAPENQLREEAALLLRAEKEYHSGHWKQTLAIVNEHTRQFPSGILKQERVTLEARARCELGDKRQANCSPKQ